MKKLFCIFCLLLTFQTFTIWAEKLPKEVKMLNKIWQSFNNKDFDKTITEADALIQEFGPIAKSNQKKLLKNKTKVYTGGKKSKEEKQKIFNLGPLHQVSVAFLLKGRVCH